MNGTLTCEGPFNAAGLTREWGNPWDQGLGGGRRPRNPYSHQREIAPHRVHAPLGPPTSLMDSPYMFAPRVYTPHYSSRNFDYCGQFWLKVRGCIWGLVSRFDFPSRPSLDSMSPPRFEKEISIGCPFSFRLGGLNRSIVCCYLRGRRAPLPRPWDPRDTGTPGAWANAREPQTGVYAVRWGRWGCARGGIATGAAPGSPGPTRLDIP